MVALATREQLLPGSELLSGSNCHDGQGIDLGEFDQGPAPSMSARLAQSDYAQATVPSTTVSGIGTIGICHGVTANVGFGK